jgi:hypothetical protein
MQLSTCNFHPWQYIFNAILKHLFFNQTSIVLDVKSTHTHLHKPIYICNFFFPPTIYSGHPRSPPWIRKLFYTPSPQNLFTELFTTPLFPRCSQEPLPRFKIFSVPPPSTLQFYPFSYTVPSASRLLHTLSKIRSPFTQSIHANPLPTTISLEPFLHTSPMTPFLLLQYQLNCYSTYMLNVTIY